jgi:hypothetical protein
MAVARVRNERQSIRNHPQPSAEELFKNHLTAVWPRSSRCQEIPSPLLFFPFPSEFCLQAAPLFLRPQRSTLNFPSSAQSTLPPLFAPTRARPAPCSVGIAPRCMVLHRTAPSCTKFLRKAFDTPPLLGPGTERLGVESKGVRGHVGMTAWARGSRHSASGSNG